MIKGFVYKLSNKYLLDNIPSQFVGNREIGCYLFGVMLKTLDIAVDSLSEKTR